MVSKISPKNGVAKKRKPTKADQARAAAAIATSSDKGIKRSTIPTLKNAQTVVTLVVGEDDSTTTFIVHKDVICNASPFFKTAFTGSFIEGETQTMRLKEVHSEVVGLLVHWLYTSELDLSDDQGLNLLSLCSLWVFAQFCRVPILQNQVTDATLIILSSEVPTGPVLKFLDFIYEHDIKELKSLALDGFAHCDPQTMIHWTPLLPYKFLVDLTLATVKDKLPGVSDDEKGCYPTERPKGYYHVAVPDEVKR